MNRLPESPNGQEQVLPGQGFLLVPELWQIVGRRKRRIVLMVVLGLSLGILYCVHKGPWYDASAQLLVIKKRLETAPISGPDQPRLHEDYLSTHMLLITSRRVIEEGIKKGNLQDLDQFREQGGFMDGIRAWVSRSLLGEVSETRGLDRMVTALIGSLTVSRDAQRPGISPSGEILNLSYRGRVAEDCPKILNALIASYQDFLQETYRNTNAETLELIDQARDVVQKDLQAKEVAYQKFLAETPPLWKGQDKSTAHQDRLFKIDAKLAALRMRRAEIVASLEMLDKAITSGRNPMILVERMATPITREPGAPNPLASQEPWLGDRKPRVSLEEELLQLMLQEAKLEALRAPSHPDVQAVRRQIASVRRLILPASGGAGGAPAKAGAELDLGRMKIELLKQELDDLRVAEQSLARFFKEEQKGVSASYSHEIQDEAFRKGIERDRLLYESILHRLKETSSVREFGGYKTQVIGPPLRGGLVVKKYGLILGLSLFAGLLGGVGWAYLAAIAASRGRAAALAGPGSPDVQVAWRVASSTPADPVPRQAPTLNPNAH